MSNVRTTEERERERRADAINSANACAYHARRAVTASRELIDARLILARVPERVRTAREVAQLERRIIKAATFIEATRARMAQ